MRLEVVTQSGEALSGRQAFVRSVVKVTIPWMVAHGAVWRLMTVHGTSPDVAAYVLLGLAYLIVLANLTLLWFPSRRLLHDRVAQTAVRSTRTIPPAVPRRPTHAT